MGCFKSKPSPASSKAPPPTAPKKPTDQFPVKSTPKEEPKPSRNETTANKKQDLGLEKQGKQSAGNPFPVEDKDAEDPEPNIVENDVELTIKDLAGRFEGKVTCPLDYSCLTLYSRVRSQIPDPVKHSFLLRFKGKVIEEASLPISHFGIEGDANIDLYQNQK